MAGRSKYDEVKYFVLECKKYVTAIQNYTGDDSLAPWYDYLLWMEENFVIDFQNDTIFHDILAKCLCQYESERKYKQDRRLIKLFIKFIIVQEEQNLHYETMISNGFGTEVADLYINWAFHFDVNSDFHKAEDIYQRGLRVRAKPLELLEAAHKEFGYSMSQRMLHQANEKFQLELQEQMQIRFNEIAALRIDKTAPKFTKSAALQMIDKDELMSICIPFFGAIATQTPEKQQNTSVAKNIIDSARKIIDSARKIRREKSRKLITSACRLDFNENAFEPTQVENSYERGIQLGRNFKSKNLPQSKPPPIFYNDDMIDKFRGELPSYDKIILIPRTNLAFSPDEFKAYNWFKKQGIVNDFTKEQDQFWGIGYDVPIRWANVFPRKNWPQSEWIVPRISTVEFESGPHKFMCHLAELYPSNSSEEFSFEEIMWRKRKAKTIKAVQHKRENSILKCSRILNRTNSTDQSKLSPIIEMELSGFGNEWTAGPQKRRESLQRNTTEPYKKRKSSIFPTFDALNDTCTTQMFSNLLHGSAISTPKTKMPKFDVQSWLDETKMKLFNDQSSEIVSDVNKQVEKVNKANNQPNDAGFAIYEDRTMTLHGIKNATRKDTMNDLTIGNKENIVLAENQQLNVDQSKFESKKCESTVMNSTAQPNEKRNEKDTLQPSKDFQFNIYTDKTDTMLNAIENARKLFDCELSIQNKENIQTESNSEKGISTTNRMNATKADVESKNVTNNNVTHLSQQSIFKEPKLPPKKTESGQRPNETTFFEILDTTEEFEQLEAQCANSPNLIQKSDDLAPLEHSFAKNVIIGAANKINDRTRLNWTQQPSIWERPTEEIPAPPLVDDSSDDDVDNECIGQSIYIKEPELEFNEKDADWKEVTIFLADTTATNDYKLEEVHLDETRHRLDTYTQSINMKELNPFDPELQKDVLTAIGFLDQLNGANNFNCTLMNIVKPLKPKSSIEINKRKYQIRKLIGSGAFGKVFFCECTKTKEMFAFKQQRPPNLWEYYVCLQIHERLMDESIRNGFMTIDFAVIGNNATIYASKFSKYGTILNVCNKVKQETNKSIEECIVMILVKQMLTIVETFHKLNFIHADIKPDNFLLMDKLSMNYEHPDIVLQLIDFGQSIDMNYFSRHVFWAKVKTENFICTQMMEDNPWTFHCDLFCLASTIYTMVAGKYMVVSRRKPTDPYKPQKLPRYVNAKLWDEIFDTLINVPNNVFRLQKMPSLSKLRQLLDNELNAIGAKKVTEAIVKFNKALD
ncbi:checkpoint serine/threonine-protein kinase BUB1-like isoform X2 [Contarinia nasturtii]|uniref:checkpoint serine/threonine-protein kinase BUB1-like isoform X2 n=1 Tax=Contarinia nasturtii TaxID=265458 RepID=UPI0012D470B9|nr:checkpoint serine/threonine-protein kinase BUB1-like isoform X2 [Contarinia nasturtii]